MIIVMYDHYAIPVLYVNGRHAKRSAIDNDKEWKWDGRTRDRDTKNKTKPGGEQTTVSA